MRDEILESLEWMEVVDVINGKTENFKNCIYMWRNKVNQKLYVGQAKDFRERTKKHKRASFNKNRRDYYYPLHNSIRKYGLENFEICILEFDLSDYYEMDKKETEMGEKEVFYIKKYDTLVKNEKGYNITTGGRSGNKFAGKKPEEMKEVSKKMSEAHKGEKAYQCRKVICITNGEIFDYIQQAAEKYGVNRHSIGDCCNHKYNSAGIIDGKPAVWMYLEDYEKLSEEEINKIKNEEVPNEGRPKAVICTTTGKIYESAGEASRQTGTNRIGITRCCNEKQKFVKDQITGEKLIFMFLDKYESLK